MFFRASRRFISASFAHIFRVLLYRALGLLLWQHNIKAARYLAPEVRL